MTLYEPDPHEPADPDWPSDGLDPEGPSPDDLERFGDELDACPSCGRDIYDQVEMCPFCGSAIERTPSKSAPAVVVIAIVLVVMLAVGWLVF
ncbi:MAG: hypothetical protein AAF235_02510 [Planctomycetota bacterium]